MTTPPHPASVVGLSLLMLIAGIGIPIMATLNAGLGQRLASPITASAVLAAVGFVLFAGALSVVGPPPLARFAAIPLVYYGGALFFVLYILGITIAAPRIGLGNAVFYVLLGQLIAATVIDHFGLWGAIATPVTARRVAGLLVMALGVYLARKPMS